MNTKQEFWTCVVGPADRNKYSLGDFPMRMAVISAFERMTGENVEICMSGWGNDSEIAAKATLRKDFVYAVEKTNSPEPELRKLTPGELLNLITNLAKEYVPNGTKSVKRNKHMNDLSKTDKVSQKIVDAVLVDFVNYIAGRYGVDYGLYTKDLRDPKRNTEVSI